ncbi:glycosyltransferase family 4 protein [Methylophaga lonarensis]|uniref:glycosyltransferase family 4 protein n=1 Tax=Methylophaga lonarensis TaxID=999151 RepID=UPI003D2BADBE
MMRIGVDIHTVGARQTGNETYIRNLLRQMMPMATEDEFFLYQTKAVALPEWMQQAQLRTVKPHNPLLRIPLAFPWALKKDAIDVALFQYVIPPISSCPMVTMIHDISFEFYPEFFNPLSRKRMQLLIPFAARKSQHVLTVSEYSKRQIVERYGIAEDKVTVTYNGVAETFSPIENQTILDSTLQRFSLDKPFILAVGNLQPRKNIERLVRVYAKLRKKGLIEQDLVLVGQMHWQGHAILAEIEKHQVAEHVKTTGYVTDDELVALYNQADVFVYPSLYEGFGLPVIESMACGTPVITSDVSSIPEVAGDAAVLIDPLSDDALSAQLERVANDAALRASLREKGLVQARKFDWKTTAEKTLSILQRAG